MTDVTETFEERKEQFALALKLGRVQASAEANEILRDGLRDTLTADRDATEMLTLWRASIERQREGEADQDHLDYLSESEQKANAMEEASLRAMDEGARENAELLAMALDSKRVALDPDVSAMLVQLNDRTLSEDAPQGLIAERLVMSGAEFEQTFKPHAGFDPAARESAQQVSEASARGQVDFSREGLYPGEGREDLPGHSRLVPRREREARIPAPEPETEIKLDALLDQQFGKVPFQSYPDPVKAANSRLIERLRPSDIEGLERDEHSPDL